MFIKKLDLLNSNLFKITSFIILYLSLYLSLYLGEDSTGGAFYDYLNQKKIVDEFVKNFNYAFFNYDNLQYTTRHSPILISIISILSKANIDDLVIRIFYLNTNILLPIFFYKCLKLKYNKIDTNILFLISLLIFLSPTFRTLIIWPDSRILGVTFFTISIYYFLKFLENKSFKNVIYNIIFYTLSSYISPNFAIFSIYFVYVYLKQLNFFSKNFLIVIFLNIFFSLPALYYIFILKVNFFFAKATVGLLGGDTLFFNFFNQILIIPTILFFYILPFIFLKIFSLDIKKRLEINLLISFLTLIICIPFFNYEIKFTGGGVFFHLSHFIFDNNLIFLIISFFSIFMILNIFSNNFKNLLVLLIIFFGNPQTTIYHKYYDPLIMILAFSLLSINVNYKNISNKKLIIYIYLYFLSFLVISNFKNLIT